MFRAVDRIANSFRRLYQLLKRRGWKQHDAEDVIQDAFVRMQRYCNEGGEVRNTEAFLVRTVLNLSSNARTRARQVLYVEEVAPESALLLGLAASIEDELAAEQRLTQVVALVDAMPSRTREIFLLHYVDEYTYPQISKQLGISVSAVEKHMARAMLQLTREPPA